jgi:hypothetical protein
LLYLINILLLHKSRASTVAGAHGCFHNIKNNFHLCRKNIRLSYLTLIILMTCTPMRASKHVNL